MFCNLVPCQKQRLRHPMNPVDRWSFTSNGAPLRRPPRRRQRKRFRPHRTRDGLARGPPAPPPCALELQLCHAWACVSQRQMRGGPDTGYNTDTAEEGQTATLPHTWTHHQEARKEWRTNTHGSRMSNVSAPLRYHRTPTRSSTTSPRTVSASCGSCRLTCSSRCYPPRLA